MLPDDPFISVDDLSAQTGHTIGTADAHALIAIDAACWVCRENASQMFNSGTAVVQLDGNGGDCLILEQRPVNSIVSVSVNGGSISDYCFSPDGKLIRGTAGSRSFTGTTPTWPYGRRNVSVTYGYGFAFSEIPRSVRMVALAVAERIWAQGPAQQESIGDQSISYAEHMNNLTPGELRILQFYNGYRSP